MISIFTSLHHEKSGQAMTEFIIVFPPLFLLFLLIIQTALLITARQVIQYSAFCAARSAIVFNGSADKAKQAADLACMPISPKFDPDSLRELVNFAMGLGNTVVDLSDYANEYPELAGLFNLTIEWNDIPGIDVLNKLRNTDLSSLYNTEKNLSDGLLLIDRLCQDRHDIPLRYPSSSLLTEQDMTPNGNDITVKLKHNYVMRIPIINKLFFLMYIYGGVRSRIQSHFSGLPNEVVHDICSRALSAIKALANASTTNSLYILPIIADCTLTIEKDAPSEKFCN